MNKVKVNIKRRRGVRLLSHDVRVPDFFKKGLGLKHDLVWVEVETIEKFEQLTPGRAGLLARSRVGGVQARQIPAAGNSVWFVEWVVPIRH